MPHRLRSTFASRNAAAAAGLLLLVAACTEDTLLGPDEILGAYAAVTAGGRVMPAFVNHDWSQTSGRRLARATLRLAPPDTMELVVDLETVGADGTVVAEALDTLVVGYALDATVLTMSRLEGPTFFDVTDPGLVLEDGSLLVVVRFPYPPVTGYGGTYPVDVVFVR